jgi:hypothetical protein
MQLPPAEPRRELHLRRIELRGYVRLDGLYDIEAHLVDTKTDEITVGSGRVIAPGQPIHDMAVRLVIDQDLRVVDVVAATDAAPHDICPEATRTLQSLQGLRIGPGWSKAVAERLAGRKGCTHLTELLKPLATVAFQTLWKVREQRAAVTDASAKPGKVDSCYAYASDRELVRRRWPIHYTGEDSST